jgi:exopolysaccharide biosynthesis polyprenyl glycosylphosphotransferase
MAMQRAARVLLLLGTVGVVSAWGKLHAELHDYPYTGTFRFGWALAYIAVLWIAAYAVGFPNLGRTRGAAVSALAAVGVAAVGISLLQLLFGSALLPRLVVFGAAATLVPWYGLCAALGSRGRVGAEERARVVIVGDHGEAEALRDDLSREPERHAQLVATLTAAGASPLDTRRKPIVDTVRRARATLLVLSQSAQADEAIVAQAAELHETGLRVRTLAGFSEEWLGKLPISELERVSLMFDISDLHRAGYARLKRVLDLVVATCGLLALAATVPIVLLGNLLGNRGPLFFRQPRVGRNGVTFEILKFRTMRDAPGPAERQWTVRGDPRITPFGRVLRRTHLDELPQVVNILRGDLSVVGPRPEQPRYVEELTAKIPFYGLRHLVRPGLTGWAQVKYPYGSNEVDALEKLQYEFYYLGNQSLGLDLNVIRRTLRHVFGLGGR